MSINFSSLHSSCSVLWVRTRENIARLSNIDPDQTVVNTGGSQLHLDSQRVAKTTDRIVLLRSMKQFNPQAVIGTPEDRGYKDRVHHVTRINPKIINKEGDLSEIPSLIDEAIGKLDQRRTMLYRKMVRWACLKSAHAKHQRQYFYAQIQSIIESLISVVKSEGDPTIPFLKSMIEERARFLLGKAPPSTDPMAYLLSELKQESELLFKFLPEMYYNTFLGAEHPKVQQNLKNQNDQVKITSQDVQEQIEYFFCKAAVHQIFISEHNKITCSILEDYRNITLDSDALKSNSVKKELNKIICNVKIKFNKFIKQGNNMNNTSNQQSLVQRETFNGAVESWEDLLKTDTTDTKAGSAFSTYLSIKKSEGFTLKDKLRYRYIDYKEATGATAFFAWLKFGGLGALFVQKSEDVDSLKKERDFYNGICKTAELFKKKNTAQGMESFEETLRDLDQEEDILNAQAILNRQAGGADVAGGFIQQYAQNELLEGNEFSMAHILNLFKSDFFVARVEELYSKGYRPASTFPQMVDDTTTIGVLYNDQNRPIFEAFSKAYGAIVRSSDGSAKIAVDTLISLQSDSEISDEVVQQAQDYLNSLLFTSIVESKGSPFGDNVDLPNWIIPQQVDDLNQLYWDYIDQINKITSKIGEHQNARKEHDKAKKELDEFENKEIELTYDEFKHIYQVLEKETVFNKLKQDLEKAEKQLQDSQKKVDQRIEELQKKNPDFKLDLEEMEKLINETESAKTKAYNDIKNIGKEISTSDGKIDDNITEKLTTTVAHSKTTEIKLQEANEMIHLWKAQSPNYQINTITEYPLVVERDKMRAQYQVQFNKTIIVTRGEVARAVKNTIQISKIDQVINMHRILNQDYESKQKRLDQTTTQVTEAKNTQTQLQNKLTKQGFVFQGTAVKQLNWTLFNENKENIKSNLVKQAQDTYLILNQMFQRTKSAEELLSEKASRSDEELCTHDHSQKNQQKQTQQKGNSRIFRNSNTPTLVPVNSPQVFINLTDETMSSVVKLTDE